ncbi:MAG: hypothetical protein AAF682_02705 [Planctomycetota bacterium]
MVRSDALTDFYGTGAGKPYKKNRKCDDSGTKCVTGSVKYCMTTSYKVEGKTYTVCQDTTDPSLDQ